MYINQPVYITHVIKTPLMVLRDDLGSLNGQKVQSGVTTDFIMPHIRSQFESVYGTFDLILY